ncbi:MAG TPA: hypothetical protein VFP20_09840 [Bacteroidales bacterium]|nr:hypothetical protein [Bacteroidales bacterium]
MKKHYFSSPFKKVAIVGLMALFCVAPKALAQWTGQWNGTDFASMSPTNFASTHDGGGTNTAKIPSIYFCDVVQDSTPGINSNSVLKFFFSSASSSSSEKFQHNFGPTPNGVTVVFRVKASPDYSEIAHIEIKNAHYRIRVRLKKSEIKDDYSQTDAQVGTTSKGSIINWPADVNPTENYVTIRIASGVSTYSLYVNENPTPLYTLHLYDSPSTSNGNFWFGKSSSGSSMGNYFDWFLWDESGAYAPGEGAAIPAEFVKSNCTRLSDVKINGVSIPAFDKDTVVYKIGMLAGSAVPTVTATASQQFLGETCTVTNATTFPGTATVTAIAADGVTPSRTYTINFVQGLANDATLKSAKVGNTTVAGFLPGKTTYDVKIASGSTTPELMSFVTNERYATAVVTDASSLPGVATILVTAQDGTTKTYTFNMSVADNTDASLTEIKVNNVPIPGFDPAVLTYNVVLPYGTTAIPSVSYSRTDPNSLASSTRTDATALPGATTILVTAADALTTKTYTVNFTVSTTGIRNLTSADVTMYNTSKSIVNVCVPESMVNGMMYVYGINGALKSQMKLNSTNVEMNINNLASGIYAVKIVGRDGMTVVKKLAK